MNFYEQQMMVVQMVVVRMVVVVFDEVIPRVHYTFDPAEDHFYVDHLLVDHLLDGHLLLEGHFLVGHFLVDHLCCYYRDQMRIFFLNHHSFQSTLDCWTEREGWNWYFRTLVGVAADAK